MHNGLLSRLIRLMSRRQLKKNLGHVAMVLSCIAIFCVTYMLVAPVLTQEWPAVCGMEEHTHTDACYTVELVEIPGESGHTHDESCYEEAAARELICTETESQGHTHDDICYEEREVLTCTEAESQGHTHSDSCYEERETLTCTDESEDHVHDSGCYSTERVLTCGETERAGHTHDAGCYGTEQVLTCTEAESQGHTHDDSCYRETVERKLVCGLEETPAAEPQYREVRTLTCGKEEHVHTDACYTPTEETSAPYICGYDTEHIHSESCYFESGELKCTIREHVHTEACRTGAAQEAPAESPLPSETPAAGSIFPATLPEGYVEADVFQPMAVFAIDWMDMEEEESAALGPNALAYVPQDAFQTPVMFVPQNIYDEEEAQALAQTLTDAGVEFDGMTALDLSFFDENYEEQEPLTGPVYVKLTLTQELPEEAQPTLWHMTQNGPEAVPADVDYDAGTGTLTLGFAVDSFSGFTVTWRETGSGASPLTVMYWGENGEIDAGKIGDFATGIWYSGNNLYEGKNYDGQTADGYIKANLPAGYEFDHYEIEVSGKRIEVTNVSYNPNKNGDWHYLPVGSSSWPVWTPSGDPTLYVVCKSTATAAVTIIFSQYTNDEFQTLSGESTVSVPVGTTLLTSLGLTPPTGYQISYFETDLGNRVDSVLCDADGKITFMNGKETVAGATLRAVCELAAHNWTGDERNRVKFFVNYTYQVLGALGEFNAPANDSTWTQAVYETYLFGDQGYTENGNEGACPAAYIRANRSQSGVMEYYIARDPDQDSNNRNLLEAHQHVLDAATETGYNNKFSSPSGTETTATYWLQSLPTDQEVLDGIKSWVENGGNSIVDVNGNELKPELLNTREFAVRWFAFKYRDDDKFWHIDGVLVKKEGHLVVEKTFSGDQTAIEAVKSGKGDNEFYISVAEDKANDDEETDLYRLYLDRAEMRQTGGTYKTLEGVTPTVSGLTYTWVLDTANTPYHIMEHNYTYNSPDVSTVTEYRFSNLEPEDRDEYHSENWTTFVSDPGLTLIGRSYAPEVGEESWQTVHFRNRYLPANALILHTVDAETDDPLPNVEFRVTANGQPLTLWLVDGIYYFYRPQGYDGLGVTSTSIARTNESGEVIFGGVGQEGTTNTSYVLTENSRPAGYSEASLQFTINGDGTIEQSNAQKAGSVNADPVEMAGSGNVYVTTLKHTVDKMPITGAKSWAGSVKQTDSVVLTLYQDGQATGATVTLSKANGWRADFDGLWPTHTPEGPIQYTVQETVGGQTYGPDREPNSGDTYAVTFAQKETREKVTEEVSGNTRTVITQLDFTVTNAESGNMGSFRFQKTNENGNSLSGARFGLYADQECTQLLATYTSGEDGMVASGALPAGTYFLKETMAPETYKLPDVAYQVTISKDGFQIKSVDQGGKEDVLLYYDKANGLYQVKNVSAYTTELPATGGSGLILWYTTGLALLLGAVLLMYKSKKREGGSGCE